MNWIEILVAWAPLLVIFAVWLLIMRQMRGKDGLTSGQYMSEILKETRRQNDLLERLVGNMEQRVARLEDRDRKS
jgi:hypothetical protein